MRSLIVELVLAVEKRQRQKQRYRRVELPVSGRLEKRQCWLRDYGQSARKQALQDGIEPVDYLLVEIPCFQTVMKHRLMVVIVIVELVTSRRMTSWRSAIAARSSEMVEVV